jgi:hypothetical protein
MSSIQWSRVALVCAVLLGVSVAAPPSPVRAEDAPEAVKMPANHRTLIAQYILTQEPFDQATLNTAEISRSFGKWGGLFRGGTMPTVCVKMQVTNLLGMTGPGYLLFTVENGQAIRLSGGNAMIDPCPPFSPFHEVRKKR